MSGLASSKNLLGLVRAVNSSSRAAFLPGAPLSRPITTLAKRNMATVTSGFFCRSPLVQQPITPLLPISFMGAKQFSTAIPEKLDPRLETLRVAFRTPITQLADKDQPDVQAVVDAAIKAIRALQEKDVLVDVLDHEVLTKTSQKDNLTKIPPKDFRKDRLSTARATDVFVEVVLGISLSLSGAVERGYLKALRDEAKRLSPAERALINEKFPARLFQGFNRSIVVMHNGREGFGGPLTTTLYKQDPDTTYFYIKHEGEKMEEAFLKKLNSDFPRVKIIEFTEEAMVGAFTEIFTELVQQKQQIVREELKNHLGLAPEDNSPYHYKNTPKRPGR